MTMKKERGHVGLLVFALILLFNPNVNTVDVLPDFIGFFILAYLIGNLGDMVPYFKETKSALMKLGFIGLLKVPATFLMFGNMSTGSDIVPLFTIVFVTLELIFLFMAISNGFSALYYIGERTNCSSTISKFTLFGANISPDFVKYATYVFFAVKGALNVIPEFCLLTVASDFEMATMRKIYPILQTVSIATVFILGIVWLVFAIKYVFAIRNQHNFRSEIKEMVGFERIKRVHFERRIKNYLSALTALAAFSFLSFDFTFTSINSGVNILPRFIFGACLMYFASRIFEKSYYKIGTYISGGAFIATSIANHLFLIRFYDNFDFKDLLDVPKAQEFYTPVKIFAALEMVSFLALGVFLIIGFLKFIKKNTALSVGDENYSVYDEEYHKTTCTKGVFLFVFPMVISILKFISTIADSYVQVIFANPEDVTSAAMFVSALPWLSALITFVCVAYVFYSYYFLTTLKEDIRMKYADQEQSFE